MPAEQPCSRCTRPAGEHCRTCGAQVLCAECWEADLVCLGCVRKDVLESAAKVADKFVYDAEGHPAVAACCAAVAAAIRACGVR